MHRGQEQGNLSHEMAEKLLRSCLIARQKRMHAVASESAGFNETVSREIVGNLATPLRPCNAKG
jgi:hypothetical protein